MDVSTFPVADIEPRGFELFRFPQLSYVCFGFCPVVVLCGINTYPLTAPDYPDLTTFRRIDFRDELPGATAGIETRDNHIIRPAGGVFYGYLGRCRCCFPFCSGCCSNRRLRMRGHEIDRFIRFFRRLCRRCFFFFFFSFTS